jgi:hypothetical protein
MTEFHRAPPYEQLLIAHRFSDPRFRRLAMRFLFVRTPQVLDPRQQELMRCGIAQRLDGDGPGELPWRSIPAAIAELESDPDLTSTAEGQRIRTWLTDRIS